MSSDEETCADEKENSARKEISVVVANIDQFGPTTSSFLESQAANGIAGFLFSESTSKNMGWSSCVPNLRTKGFAALSQRLLSLSCLKQVRAEERRHCSGRTLQWHILSAPSNRM